MKQIVVALFVTLTLLVGLAVTVSASTILTNRVTGVDQSDNPTVLYCSGSLCHSVYGYIYGDPITVTGDLWRVAPAARGYTWRLVGPVDVTCQSNAKQGLSAFELVCDWVAGT